MLISNYKSRSSVCATTLVALHLATATGVAASTPVDGLRWTAEDLPLPSGVSSLVATGATKEGVIIAYGLKAGAVDAFVFMPSAAYDLAAGWNDLGPAEQREMPTTAIAASGTAGASIAITGSQLEFSLAIANSYDQCGVGITSLVPDNHSGWITSVSNFGTAIGAFIGQTTTGAIRITPFRANATSGIQEITLPVGHQNAVPLDQAESGWIVGTAQTTVGWRGVVGTGAAFMSLNGRIRNRPDAVIESCVGVTESTTIIANLQTAPGQFRPVLLKDARADYRPTGTVDFDDLAEYVLDYSESQLSADIDASGSVTESDLDGFVTLWITAQISDQASPINPEPLSIFHAAVQGGAAEQCPTALRAAAVAKFQLVVAQLTASDLLAVAPEVPQDCEFKPFEKDSPERPNYCGSEWADVPDFFPECCSNHDNCYRGYSVPKPTDPSQTPGPPPPGGRIACDDEFLACMKSRCDSDQRCPIKNFGCHIVAFTYYVGVRAFGQVRLFGPGAFCACRQHSDPGDCGGPAAQTSVGLLGSAVMP